MLNGGIVLTGGGSQLKHLIQLTEYVTGLNARIGFPNEHLAAGHIDELAKPVYSTCIGLILKGYDDYEHDRKQFEIRHLQMQIPKTLQKEELEEEVVETEDVSVAQRRKRLGIGSFWGKFKDNLIDLFKEEEDKAF
jgi:cell division protein FtsA